MFFDDNNYVGVDRYFTEPKLIMIDESALNEFELYITKIR